MKVVPAAQSIYSYAMSCRQIKNFMVFMMMLLIPCTKNYKES